MPRRKIGKILIPGIAHRGMEIRNVERVRVGNDALGYAVRAGDDELEFLQVEELGSQRKKGEVRAVVLSQKRPALEKARPYLPLLDRGSLATLKMEERIDRRPGKDFGQDFEDFFSPSPSRQPIMDEGDLDVLNLS